MKKIMLCTLSIALVLLFVDFANTNKVKASEEVTFIYFDENQIVPISDLDGTSLENKNVEIKDNMVYVNEERAVGTVTVFIAGILAGFLVDGVLIYTTGYTGGELSAAGISALVNIWRNHNATTAYFSSKNSTNVSSFINTSGATCVPRGNVYACSYSV